MPEASLAAMFREGLAQARKQQKSDDIVSFIRDGWRMFCCSRARMDAICEELAQRGELDVDSLSSALGIPGEVLFKKVKAVDTARLFLHMKTSPLMEAFMKQLDKRRTQDGRDPGLCMFAVAGEHTLVVTNMSTERADGTVRLCLCRECGDIDVFPAKDAPVRLPGLFGAKEE